MANIIIQDMRQARKKELEGKQDTIVTFAALMGRGDGERPDVDGREGYVWVRVGHAQALQMAYNSRVMPRDDLPIYVGYEPEQPNLLQVISVRQESYVNTNQGMIPVVKDHHLTHEWGGGDDVWIAYRRLVDLHLGQPAGFVVTLNPGLVYRSGTYMWIPQQTLDLSASQPGVGAQARYVLVYLDAAGTLSSRDGTIRPNPTSLLVTDIPIPLAGEIAIAAVRLYASQTEIGDDPDNRDIVELREFQPYSAAGVHDILSATHDDTTPAACVLGDIITGQAGPAWARLAISVPAANVRNVLGIDNGETGPSWKAMFDANNPTTIGIGDAAAPGTSLLASHRDHQHASPATWTATAHNLLSAIHGDTTASNVARGDLVVGVAGPSWDNLALGGAAGSLLTRDANDVAWSAFYMAGHAGRTYDFPDYDINWPAADAHGYLHSDGAGTLTWDAGAGGAAAGNDHNVQYNDGGAFGGDDDLSWDHAGNVLTITGDIHFADDAVPTTRYISVDAQAAADTNGNALDISAGDGKGTSYGGTVTINGGDSIDTPGSVGGDVVLAPGVGNNAGQTGFVKLKDPDSGIQAILTTFVLAAADKTFSFPNADGTFALGAGTLTVATGSDANVSNHTHMITSSSNPGAAASILASDAAGDLTLHQGNFTTLHTTTLLVDHIGEHTGAHGIVFDNDATRVGKISVDHLAEATGAHNVVIDNILEVTNNIKFPAVQVASADANTLDDYEEGTWTPALKFGGASVDMTYSVQTGTYTKIGRLVYVNAVFTLSAKGSSVGAATITGLPFTVGSNSTCAVYGAAMANLTSTILGRLNGTSILLYDTSATANTGLDDTNFNNNSVINLGAVFAV